MENQVKYRCGIDEAGRGPLAGPVTASAVILPPGFPFDVLDDSKKLSARERRRVAGIIRHLALDYAVGWSWPEEIDRLNIHRATLLAMKRAYCGLKLVPGLVLVDGRFIPPLSCEGRAIIKGDTFIPQIQAASVIAKTTRDLWMERYARIETGYGFEKHKGYPTVEHRQLVSAKGLSPIHRRSFRIKLP